MLKGNKDNLEGSIKNNIQNMERHIRENENRQQ